MKLSQITEYLSRSHRELKKIASKEDVSIIYLWYDFLTCSIIHGAIINHYCRGGLYKQKGCERKKALTYGRILKLFKKFNQKESIKYLNDKHLFNAHFAAFVNRKWLYSKNMSFDDFCSLCDGVDKLIIKPEGGMEGNGIRICPPPQAFSDRRALFESLSNGSFMIEECIKQHSELIYGNASVNTIRAHSIIDSEGEVHLCKMIFRVGVGNSVVDNYAHGGCAYEVQMETGRIISPSLTKDGAEVYIHPQTSIFMLGRQIPNWEKVIEGVKKAHAMLPGCRFIGWDVAITNDGIELIEGNHNTDYEFFEFFGSKGWYKIIKKFL